MFPVEPVIRRVEESRNEFENPDIERVCIFIVAHRKPNHESLVLLVNTAVQ